MLRLTAPSVRLRLPPPLAGKDRQVPTPRNVDLRLRHAERATTSALMLSAQRPTRATVALAAIVLLGLALRLWCARGGLWVDEAWSAQFVAQAGSVSGIFWRVNHDNNHYLNSLWILLVGPYAPPLLIRALSIVAGTASIAVAAAIGWRRTPSTGLVAAILFAVSPILVAYGAEARGYGPMLLAMLWSVLMICRWLDGDAPPPAWSLAALTFAGLLAQLTYLFAIATFTGWIVMTLARRGSIDAAVAATARVLGPSLAVLALVIAFVVAAASASPTGFQAGGFPGFTLPGFAEILAETIAYTVGLALPATWATIAAAVLAIVAMLVRTRPERRPFYLVATIAFPAVLAVALWRIDNAGFARYYLVAVVGLLLLLGDAAGVAISRGGWYRTAGFALILLIVGASLYRDAALGSAARGDPGLAIAAMRARSPAGAGILVDTIRPVPVLDVAARSVGYPLAIRRRCPAPAFAFVDLVTTAPPAVGISRCGTRYSLVRTGRHLALSGLDWALYARADLPEKRGSSTR